MVEAFFSASQLPGLELMNIGTGVETSVNELYQTMASLVQTTASPKYEPSRSGELERSSLDPTHAKNKLNWVPQTSLLEGLSSTIDWFREN